MNWIIFPNNLDVNPFMKGLSFILLDFPDPGCTFGQKGKIMEVITIESKAYQDLIERLDALDQKLSSQGKEEWLDNQDVCMLLKISKRTLQSYRDSGKIPYHRIGNKILYRGSEIANSLESFNMNEKFNK